MQHTSSATADKALGELVRQLREARQNSDPAFSLRRLAMRCGITPAFLSRFERGEVLPPGETVLLRLAQELDLDPDAFLAMAGKISSDLREVILLRPTLFADLIRSVKTMPDYAILRLVRDVRDGDW